jgi:hypothetical protein
MAKHPYRKRKIGKKRKYYSRRGSKSQAKQLLSLDKRVTKLTKRILKPTQFQVGDHDASTNGIHFTNFDLSTFGGRPLVYQLVCPKYSSGSTLASFGWKKIFETDVDASNITNPDNQYEYSMSGISTRFCIEVEATNRTQPNWYQLFIVSLKKDTAQQTMEATADMSQVREGYEYVDSKTGVLEANCLWKLNPSVFDIHYNSGPHMLGVHPFYGAQGASAVPEEVTPGNYVTNISDVTKTHKNYLKRRTRLIARPNTAGPVNGYMDLEAKDIPHTRQVYVMAFTNAQGGVTGNRLSYSANHVIYGSTVN